MWARVAALLTAIGIGAFILWIEPYVVAGESADARLAVICPLVFLVMLLLFGSRSKRRGGHGQ